MAEVKRQIAAQDECAPDALEYFNISMKMLCGLEVDEFKTRAERFNDGDRMRWRFSNLELHYAADHPYYVLYRVEDDEDGANVLTDEQFEAVWGIIQHMFRDLKRNPNRIWHRGEVLQLINNELATGPTIVSTPSINIAESVKQQSQYTPKERADMFRSSIKSFSESQAKQLYAELSMIDRMLEINNSEISSLIFLAPGLGESAEIHKKSLVNSLQHTTKLISRKSEIIGSLHNAGWISDDEWIKYIQSDSPTYSPKIEW